MELRTGQVVCRRLARLIQSVPVELLYRASSARLPEQRRRQREMGSWEGETVSA